MKDEGRATGGLDPDHDRAAPAAGPGGVGGHPTATRVTTAGRARPVMRVRPMPRSISAPTIAGSWSRARPATASA